MTKGVAIIAILALFVRQPLNAEPISVGETAFELGDDAFPHASQCLDPTGCGNEDIFVHDLTHPLFPPVSPANTLLGHRLDLITVDLDDADIIRLGFPIPIQNQPGDDLYLGQALILSSEFSDPQGINDLDLRFGGSSTWQTAGLLDHVRDNTVVPIVTYSDPELKQFAYNLWYTKLDLSDYGLAPGQTVQEIDIRGTLNLGNSWLDLAIVGNLNATAVLVGDISGDGEVDIGDFTRWADAYGSTGIGLPEDLSGDGEVDIGDFTIWGDNFGNTAGVVGGANRASGVPEPSTFVVAGFGAISLVSIGWRRRRNR